MHVTPLHYAALYSRKPEVLSILLDEGGDVGARDIDNMTPLHFAAGFNENEEVLSHLIERGALLDAPDVDGRTPLHYAVIYNWNARVAKILVESGADVNVADDLGYTPLHSAVRYTRDDQPKVTAKGTKGPADKTQYEITRLLLNAGADVNARTDKGVTPLHDAVVRSDGRTDAVKLLIGRGADVNAQTDNNEMTPLHGALAFYEEGSTRVVQMLLDSGATVEGTLKRGGAEWSACDIINGVEPFEAVPIPEELLNDLCGGN